LFLKTGGIVATKSSEGDVEVLEDEDPAVVFNKPLVVLTSPISASASEILAGALKDYRRAVIVGGGVQTFGKGTVQKLQPLPRGLGALKITTGMFFVPSGQSTQQIGVTSDIVVPSILSSYDDGEKALDYSLTPQSTKPFVGGTGNSSEGDERWSPITSAVVSKLTARSEGRVKGDALMKEIEKEVAEAKKDRAAVKLADLRREAAEAKKKASTDKPKGDDKEGKEDSAFERYQKAFVMEGVRIAVDLIEALGA
jgi:carboxyl-terminal processing protease